VLDFLEGHQDPAQRRQHCGKGGDSSSRGSKTLQTATLDPKKSVELRMKDGPIVGSRTIVLVPLCKVEVRVDVAFDYRLNGIPKFACDAVEDELSRETEEALTRIAREAERLAHAPKRPTSPSNREWSVPTWVYDNRSTRCSFLTCALPNLCVFV
jgi:hypothetical protein